MTIFRIPAPLCSRRHPARRLSVAATTVAALLVSTGALTGPATAAGEPAGPDFDGDGTRDLVLGGDRVGIRYGDGTLRVFTPYPGEEEKGASAAATGDFDGDGNADLAVGNLHPAGGAVFVYPGGPHGILGGDGTGTPTLLRQGLNLPGLAEGNDDFGLQLAAGDLTGDGIDDLAIGAARDNLDSAPWAGSVTLVPGGPDGLVPPSAQLFSQDTPGVSGVPESGDSFGSALAVGDVTGDGLLDLAVGVEGENQRGMVYLLRGRAGGPTDSGSTSVTGAAVGIRATPGDETEERDAANFGHALAIADLTRDGRGELVVGAPNSRVGSVRACGAIAVLRGRAGGIAAARAQVRSQSSTGVHGVCEDHDMWGEALTTGDLTGDGRPEVVVGAPREGVGTVEWAGAYTVLRPASTGITGTGSFGVTQATRNVPGVVETDAFAAALATADINRDGRADVIAGSPGEDTGGTFAGAVSLLPSTAQGRPGATSFSVTNQAFTPNIPWLGAYLSAPIVTAPGR